MGATKKGYGMKQHEFEFQTTPFDFETTSNRFHIIRGCVRRKKSNPKHQGFGAWDEPSDPYTPEYIYREFHPVMMVINSKEGRQAIYDAREMLRQKLEGYKNQPILEGWQYDGVTVVVEPGEWENGYLEIKVCEC